VLHRSLVVVIFGLGILANNWPWGIPVKEKAAFSEQLVNKYEDEKGNKKVVLKQ
jgi:hypothetical protein